MSVVRQLSCIPRSERLPAGGVEAPGYETADDFAFSHSGRKRP